MTSGEDNPDMRVPADKTGLAVAYFGMSSDLQFIDFEPESTSVSFDVSELNAQISMQTTPAASAGAY